MVSSLCVQIHEGYLSGFEKQKSKLLKHQVSSHDGAYTLDEWLFLSSILFQDEVVLRYIIEQNEVFTIEFHVFQVSTSSIYFI
jgi:hypothetical protein